MIPRRTIDPQGAVVTLPELKAHLRVDGTDDDDLIEALEKAAVSHLEGWRGILGRCIKRQTWLVEYDTAGAWRLPFPDVLEVSASAGEAKLGFDKMGAHVSITEACTVAMVCELPADTLETVKLIIKLLVGHWYQNREASTELSLKDTPMAVDALLSPIKWRQI